MTYTISYSDNGNNTAGKETVGIGDTFINGIVVGVLLGLSEGCFVGVRMVCMIVGVSVGMRDGLNDGTLVWIGEALVGFALPR